MAVVDSFPKGTSAAQLAGGLAMYVPNETALCPI